MVSSNLRTGARERPPLLTQHKLPPPRVVADDHGLHLTPQLRIERSLDALQAVAVDAGEPEHLAGERAMRVDPLRAPAHCRCRATSCPR